MKLRIDAENHYTVANDEVASTVPRASAGASEGSSEVTSLNNIEHVPNVLDNNDVKSQCDGSFDQNFITVHVRISVKPKSLTTSAFLGSLAM